MRVSIIIATLNRQRDLSRALEALSQSTRVPEEVIVIEQGNAIETQGVIAEHNSLPVTLLTIQEKSLTHARNAGVARATGELLIFIDDDVVLDAEYVHTAVVFMQEHPRAQGLTGRDTLLKRVKRPVSRFVGMFFYAASYKEYSCVLVSGHNILRNSGQEVQNIEWLSGSNMVLRRSLFTEDMMFNTDFIRWSFGEDVMFTYQVYKQDPLSLYYVPSLVLQHHQSSESRMPSAALIKMRVVYRYLFWRQELAQGITIVPYVLSQIALGVLVLAQSRTLASVTTLWRAHVYLVVHKRAIREGTCDFNSFIVKPA